MEKFFELIPSGTNFDFVGRRKRFLLISLIMILTSFGILGVNAARRGSALNFGIDFSGGSQVRLALTKSVELNEIRGAMVDLGYEGSSAVAVPDAENQVMIRVKDVTSMTDAQEEVCKKAMLAASKAPLSEDNGFVHPNESSKIFMKFTSEPDYAGIEKAMTDSGCAGQADPVVGKEGEYPVDFSLVGVGNKIISDLDGKFGEGTVDHLVSSETVGSKVGDQLKVDGAAAMLYAIFGIFIFVMLRFDLRFAPGGIVALTHDAIIVVGAFALTWREFNLQTIAALLTIVGYSINDTIVVFDRVRERVNLDRDAPIEETTNKALNETLSRTVLTSTTTLLVVVSIWVLGSGPIKDFAFALFIGMIVVTYSSLFVASPIFLWVNDRFYQGRGHLAMADEEGTGTLLGSASSGEDGVVGGGAAGPADGAGPGAGVDIGTGEGSDGSDDGPERPGGSRRRRRRRPGS